jgi:pyrroline-5-carboxylate reductase
MDRSGEKMSKEQTFGFIGTGNMGSALARAVAKEIPGGQIFLSNRTEEKAVHLASELGGQVCSNREIAADCDFIFLGVKPQMMAEMLDDIAPELSNRGGDFVLVSMAAGLSIGEIQKMAGGDYPVIRIMPNTPAAIGEGMILYTAGETVPLGAIEVFESVLAGAGQLDAIPEQLMDAGSAVSGCGPAFVYLFIEALADGGVACGLPRAKAQLYAAETLVGAARLVLESGEHPGTLKDAVCSPGGSTIAGVRALEKGAFRGTVMDAVMKAFEKTKQLGKN